MIDKEFAKRLNIACDGHPHIPPYGHGRQTWIKEYMKVSHEAVRKWFMGEARPRPAKMKELARALEVDEAWLALGIKPDLEPIERRARNAQAEGAVNVAVGIMQLNGARCAFPGDKDPRAAFIDFYAILRGQQMAFHVSLATEMSPSQYKFVVPREFSECFTVGMVHSSALQLHFVRLSPDLIDRHKVRRGGYFEIVASRRDGEYHTGADIWPRIRNLNRF